MTEEDPYARFNHGTFTNTQQIDHSSIYHPFKFVSINYIPESKIILEPNC